jgi:hypothetical protein
VHEPHAPTLAERQNVSSCRRTRPIARCSLLLDIEEGPPQDVDADVMQERCHPE